MHGCGRDRKRLLAPDLAEAVLAGGSNHLVPAPPSPPPEESGRAVSKGAYVMTTCTVALQPALSPSASLPQLWRRRRPWSTRETCWSPRCRWALPPPRCGSSPPAPTQWWTRRAGWARVHACATVCRAGRAWIAWAARLVCALDMGRGSSLAVQPCCTVPHAHACSAPLYLRRCCPSRWRSSSRRCCKVRTLRHAHCPCAIDVTALGGAPQPSSKDCSTLPHSAPAAGAAGLLPAAKHANPLLFRP